MSRFHLAELAIRFSGVAAPRAAELSASLQGLIEDAVRYSREHLEDAPEIRDWKWTD